MRQVRNEEAHDNDSNFANTRANRAGATSGSPGDKRTTVAGLWYSAAGEGGRGGGEGGFHDGFSR